jgi:hypothetical protein
VASPSSYGSFIRNSQPVLTGAFNVPFIFPGPVFNFSVNQLNEHIEAVAVLNSIP